MTPLALHRPIRRSGDGHTPAPNNPGAAGELARAPGHGPCEAAGKAGKPSLGRWLGMLAVLGSLAAGIASFLPHQTLWLDEATQMSGLSLSPIAAARWLTGARAHDFGQFKDRMPPLSYWLGWAWSQVVGLNERSLRCFEALCVLLAAAFVYEGARLAFGTRAAWAAGLLFAVSPPVIVLAVEIRAYPLFLLWSALAFYLLITVVAGSSPPRFRSCLALAAVLGAAVATHFFGAVLAGSILVALSILAYRDRNCRRPLLWSGAVLAVAMAAVLPFIRSALARTRGGSGGLAAGGNSSVALKRLLTSLVSHETLAVYPPLCTLAVAAALLLALMSGVVLARNHRRAGVAIATVLSAGMAAIALGKAAIAGFDAALPNYNCWMRPGLCIFLAAGLTSRKPSARLASAAALVALATIQLCGVYQLAVHGDHFAHGPHRSIASRIRELASADLAVVHDDSSNHPVFIYCPIRYDFGPTVKQYQLVDSNPEAPSVGNVPDTGESYPGDSIPHRFLLVIRSERTSPGALRAEIRGERLPAVAGPIAHALRSSPSWRFVGETRVIASIPRSLISSKAASADRFATLAAEGRLVVLAGAGRFAADRRPLTRVRCKN